MLQNVSSWQIIKLFRRVHRLEIFQNRKLGKITQALNEVWGPLGGF